MEEKIVKPTLKERLANGWAKTKDFVSTHKKQIVRGALIACGMVLGIAVYREGQKPVEAECEEVVDDGDPDEVTPV